MIAKNHQHPLQAIFHPDWNPSDDCQLLRLRDGGAPLARIAQALMRHPKAVEQRWHRLRVVPGVRRQLQKFAEENRTYPVEFWNPQGLGEVRCAP
jgi:hypothetical protein